MKKTSIFSILLVFSLHSYSQVKQTGTVLEYQGNKPKTVLSKVKVMANGASLNSETNENGEFILEFKNRKIGDKINNVRVQKPGYIIFNLDTINQWSIRKDPYKLILCDSITFYKNRDQQLIHAQESYIKQHKDDIAKINELKISNSEKEQKINELNVKFEKAIEELKKVIDKLSRIDESELDSIGKKLIQYRVSGNYQLAIDYLKSIDYENIIKTNKEESEKCYAIRMEQAMNYILKGGKENLLIAKNELWKNVEDNKTDFYYLNKYASFCSDYDFTDEAILYYEKILSYEDLKTLILMPKIKGNIYLNLGSLYNIVDMDVKSIQYFQKALNLWEEIYGIDDDNYEYLSNIAKTKLEIGALYRKNNYSKAETAYNESMIIYEKLYKEFPYIYNIQYAVSLSEIANLFVHNPLKYNDAKEMLLKSIDIRENAYKSDTTDVSLNARIAIAYAYLARLYDNMSDYPEAEKYLYKSLGILKTISDIFLYDYIVASNDLGIVLKNQKKHSEALKVYLDALEMLKEDMVSEKGKILGNIGNLMRIEKKYEEAEKYLIESLNISEMFNKQDAKYKIDVASDYYNLGILYHEMKNSLRNNRYTYFNLSSEYLNKALVLYKELTELLPEKYELSLYNVYITCAKVFIYEKKKYNLYIKEAKKIATKYNDKERIKEIELLQLIGTSM